MSKLLTCSYARFTSSLGGNDSTGGGIGLSKSAGKSYVFLESFRPQHMTTATTTTAITINTATARPPTTPPITASIDSCPSAESDGFDVVISIMELDGGPPTDKRMRNKAHHH